MIAAYEEFKKFSISDMGTTADFERVDVFGAVYWVVKIEPEKWIMEDVKVRQLYVESVQLGRLITVHVHEERAADSSPNAAECENMIRLDLRDNTE